MPEKEIGKIEKYFSHVGVGVVNLKESLRLGDTIHVKGHTSDFTQDVESMQIEHASVQEAGSGDSAGLKLKDRARPGDTVYLVTE